MEIINSLVKEKNAFYRRYSDDIIILCNQCDVNFIENFVQSKISNVNLTISSDKTEKFLFKKENGRLISFKLESNKLIKNIPLTYLGFEFYGYKTLIKSSNLASFYREMKKSIKRKNSRVQKININKLVDSSPLFKRKLYRLYSFKGVKSRKLPIRGKTRKRKFRGNYIRYAYRASVILNAPEIKRQVKNHWIILQNTLKKYDFSNVKKD